MMDTPTSTCIVGVKDCSGAISSPLVWNATTKETNFSCTAAASLELSPSGLLNINSGTATYVVANVSSSNSSSYSLFVNETGEITLVGDSAAVLWTQAAPPAPASGACPTDFSKRTLKAVELDSCSCIQTARWRRITTGRVNMTASWCSRLCQASPDYVAAAPRADGECWCGTPEVYRQTITESEKAQNCNAKCPFCPGAPVEACGQDNSVAIYTWSSSYTV